MKRLMIALALLAPVAAQANQWDFVCGGVNASVFQNAKSGTYLVKNKVLYVVAGGVNYNGVETDVYAPFEGEKDGKVLVDISKSFELEQIGVDNKTKFRLIDGRGNHSCSVNSFKAGE